MSEHIKLLKQVEACLKQCKGKGASKMGLYWSERGKYSPLGDLIREHLIPAQGESDYTFAECFRMLSKLYWDFYNNGGGNIVDSYQDYLKFVVRYCENRMDPPLDVQQRFALEQLTDFVKDVEETEEERYRSYCNNTESDTDDINYKDYIGSLDALIDAVCLDAGNKWVEHLRRLGERSEDQTM